MFQGLEIQKDAYFYGNAYYLAKFLVILVTKTKSLRSSITSLLTLLCIALVLTGCSRKKNTFLSRNFHAIGTEYNILYNGNIALQNGIERIDDPTLDNYWELLPVERMEIRDDVFLPSQSKNEDFTRAEEKAVKAVQKHGMNIKGREYNPQIDEAYLLLGKARYYDQRFVPALQAFNYILYKYPTSDKINTAKVWREKTNIRMENNELAIKNLKRLLEQEELEEQDLADANAMLAQAYINIQSKDSALVRLAVAEEFTNNKTQKARYNYIMGQLHNEFDKPDSADMAFDRIIEMHRKIPRAFYINAHIAKSNHFDPQNDDPILFEEYLTELEENRENRPFLDRIYYRIAEYHRETGSDSLADAYYNKSLRTNSADKILLSKDYVTLGDMSFDKNQYKTAGAYYDSTLTNMVENSKPYRIIKRKRESLEDVIYYEGIAQTNDSILRLVRMPEADRLAYFTEYTDSLRIKAEEEREKAEIQAALDANSTGLASAIDNPQLQQRSSSAPPGAARGESLFYFYNQTTVSFGKNEFVKVWGDRKLEDNWRLSDTRASLTGNANDDVIASINDDEMFDPQFYLDRIPTEQVQIDSIAKDRNYAYYQLGTIYKEKFQEYTLAKNKLENLLDSNPESRLILPSKYNLHKIYLELGMDAKAESMKSEIVTNYPDSRYAEILLNPRSELAKDENSPERIYETIYETYKEQKYAEVISQTEKYIDQFEGDPLVPKFEILKASANGRLYGFDKYKQGVNFIALTYPNSEEGKQAIEIIDNVIPVLDKKEFVEDTQAKHFNVLYPFDANATEEIEAFLEDINTAIEKVNYFDLSTSVDVYDPNTTFVVVHGLTSAQGAGGFAVILEENKHTIEHEFYAISSPNYEIVQRHKNLNQYLESQ